MTIITNQLTKYKIINDSLFVYNIVGVSNIAKNSNCKYHETRYYSWTYPITNYDKED